MMCATRESADAGIHLVGKPRRMRVFMGGWVPKREKGGVGNFCLGGDVQLGRTATAPAVTRVPRTLARMTPHSRTHIRLPRGLATGTLETLGTATTQAHTAALRGRPPAIDQVSALSAIDLLRRGDSRLGSRTFTRFAGSFTRAPHGSQGLDQPEGSSAMSHGQREVSRSYPLA